MTRSVITLVASCLTLMICCVPDGWAADGPNLQVIGTVRMPNGGIAICRDPATSQTFSLKVGSGFGGWTLSAVGGNGATFERGTQSATLIIASPAGLPLAQSSPLPIPASAQPMPMPAAADGGSGAVPEGKWVDGDGQTIDAPRKAK